MRGLRLQRATAAAAFRTHMSDVNRLLGAAAAGDAHAASELLPLAYDELRKFSEARVAEERPGPTTRPPRPSGLDLVTRAGDHGW